MRGWAIAGVAAGALILGAVGGAGGLYALQQYEAEQTAQSQAAQQTGVEADAVAVALEERRQDLRARCAEIIADAEARALPQLGEGSSRRERAEVLMDSAGEIAVIGEIRHGPARWPARYAVVGGSAAAEYDRYSRPELTDLWAQARARGESICVVYS